MAKADQDCIGRNQIGLKQTGLKQTGRKKAAEKKAQTERMFDQGWVLRRKKRPSRLWSQLAKLYAHPSCRGEYCIFIQLELARIVNILTKTRD